MNGAKRIRNLVKSGRDATIREAALITERENYRSSGGSSDQRLVCRQFLPMPGKLGKFPVDEIVQRAAFERSMLRRLAGAQAGENFQPLIDAADGIHVEFPAADGVDYFMAQHEILLVLLGNNDALLSRQAACFANIEKPLDFLIDTSDRLDLPLLIDGSCDRDVLTERSICQTRENRIDLR